MIVFENLVPDMLGNKRLNAIVTETLLLFLSNNLILLHQKNITLNSTQYFIMAIPNKQEFQEVTFDHSSEINLKTLLTFTKNVLQNDTHDN